MYGVVARQKWEKSYFQKCKLYLCFSFSPSFSELENSGWVELLLHSWATEVIIKGFKKTLELADLMDFVKSEAAKANFERFQKFYKEEQRKSGKEDVSVGKVLFKALTTRYIIACLVLLISLTFTFLGPVSSVIAFSYSIKFML